MNEDADPVAAAAAAVRQADAAGLLAPANRTLRFQVCNGFANQRLSIMYGALLAVRLGRSLVLPVMIDNGLQRSDGTVLASGDNWAPFDEMYDQPYFVRAMAEAGLRVLAPEAAPPPSSYAVAPLAEYGWSVAAPLAARFGDVDHLAVDCPLFKMMAADLSPDDWELVWEVLDALRPCPRAAALVDRIVQNIAALDDGAGGGAAAAGGGAGGGGGGSDTAAAAGAGAGVAGAGAVSGGSDFNFIHLRIENDWLAHCSRWQSINDGVVRDNCYNHTDDIGARLALFGLSNRTTLYVASYWEDVEKARRDKAFAQLAAAGYRIVTSGDVWPHNDDDDGVDDDDGDGLSDDSSLDADGASSSSEHGTAATGAPQPQQRPQQQRRQRRGLHASGGGGGGSRPPPPMGREFAAMVEYFVGLRSGRFIGNSVSTFAALGLLERRHRGRWAAYYNGGNIPLAGLLPGLHKLPWVFTYNSWSPDYEYMLRGAVRSGLATRSLQPYCIFQGNTSSPIATWLAAQGVKLIAHAPVWREALLKKARTHAKDNVHHSHLFRTPDMLVSTFQRVDLPVVPLLDQYTYVLYTDADVYFRRPIALDDFGLPLPRSVAMSYEFVDMFPYNAGVILANLPTMRSNYEAFIKMMLANDNGLYYTNYGPADQGIMNKFYESDLRQHMLSQSFNTKPYNPHDPNAFLLHFHGPKPHDLLAFLTSGKCDFFTVCELAFVNGLCTYTSEWVQWVYDDVDALRLEDACGWLATPAVAQLFKSRWGLQGDFVAAAGGGAEGAVPAAHRADFVMADDLRALLRAWATFTNGTAPGGNLEDQDQEREREDGRSSSGSSSGGPGGHPQALVSRLRRALLQRAQQREEREREAEATAASSRLQRRRQQLAALRGHSVGAGQHHSGEGSAGSEAEQQQQGQAQQQQLMDFDRFHAVTADETALQEAWESPAASVTASSGSDGSGVEDGERRQR